MNKHPDLHPYQQKDLEEIFSRIARNTDRTKLLYQLPTGGGKTHVFSEIVRRYIEKQAGKALILTHRCELCKQTSRRLTASGVANTIIDRRTRKIPGKSRCYVAMVETLKNRIDEGLFDPREVGLVIVDEAHHNAFRTLLDQFERATLIGVTATPLSSNRDHPLHETYHELVSGESIDALIAGKHLAKPNTVEYDVELGSLRTGDNGDYTVSTSDVLYASPAMLELLQEACERHAARKKTLIFNHGVFTSREVCRHFSAAGYDIRHLDHHTPDGEREEILRWFRQTPGALLSSVSILTTGFDEPGVQCVILNRATTSLTLYHQMVGRASRYTPRKKTFTLIDLGNNVARFGEWQEPLDWPAIFRSPESYYAFLHAIAESQARPLTAGLRDKFPNTLQLGFDIQQAWQDATDKGEKPQRVIHDAIRQHAEMCVENSDSIAGALELVPELDREIAYRVKTFGKCRGKVTRNYITWLEDDYRRRLRLLIEKMMVKTAARSRPLSA